MIDSTIFRAYDIRGIVGEGLTEASLYQLGLAIGSMALDAGDTALAVGRDGRLSGPMLVAALKKGVLATGCDVIDIGVVPTPLLYYATFVLGTRSGTMLTGSHNPPEYNGLKTVIAGSTLAEAGINALHTRIQQQNFYTGQGQCTTVDLTQRYIQQITGDIQLARPLKIVVDCGSGAAGEIAPALYRALGCEVHALYCEIDGNFPHHHPDPSQPENLADLIRAVRATQADVGLAFDGDGDRLGVVTRDGEVIWPDRQLALFARDVLQAHPGATIIYDVKCSMHLAREIRLAGGEPLMWKTGHSLVKAKLAETGAKLAGEMSGHIFFKDRWYGFDDAVYAGARLLAILANTTQTSSEVFATIPDSVNTPELKIAIADSEKFLFMEKLAREADFGVADISTIDGLRVSFADGWGLVRPSNTTPCLVLRFEADNAVALQSVQQIFKQALLKARPGLAIPF